MNKIDVIILAGGLGTRLRQVVSEVPKCMAPVCGKPFLSYLLDYLKNYSVDKVILSVGYLRDSIIQYIDNQKHNYNFEFDFAIEETPLGTGGGIRLALEKATTPNVLVLNGDTFFNVDVNSLIMNHLHSEKDITIALKPMENFERYGNVLLDGNGCVVEFQEKTFCAKGQINGGVYVLRRESDVMNGLPEKFSFETEVLQKQAKTLNINGVMCDDYFIDIGIPEDYAKANMEFDKLKF
jgi:D-glycero-alpha-D-manno-heptose 1-phosphate guanylyltransferase